ncbi:MAG: DNA (cytosine-5-)-methyltransferase [Desulfovibrionaceae bacterium]
MLKVFEAFAGYGSQRMALRNLEIPHQVVGISEVDGDAILSYASIHTNFLRKLCSQEALDVFCKEDAIGYLEHLNIPLDYKTFENKAKKLNLEQLKRIYFASKLSNNYGDIRRIDPCSIPDFDLFTYSFPCQDISIAGYQKGLDKNSETRSSLLWECCKIIEIKRPYYLLMENVKNLVGNLHKNNFIDFLNYLKNLGYKNNWAVLNARNYGIPQNRERVFCISLLGDNQFVFPNHIPLTKSLKNFLEDTVESKFYLKNQVLEKPIHQEISYCIDANYWKGATLESFIMKHRRQLVTDKQNSNGTYTPRILTPLETWRLMGCSDRDFYNAKKMVSNTSLYRQAGNSIVVSVLEAIFGAMFNARFSLQVNEKNKHTKRISHREQYSFIKY